MHANVPAVVNHLFSQRKLLRTRTCPPAELLCPLQEMIITDLQAETTYSVTVAAYTTKGDGARSKLKLITTTGAGERITPTKKLSLETTQLCK